MKRWWHYLLFGIIAWLFFMLWRFPAPVAYEWFSSALDEQISVHDIRGTVWRGEAKQLQFQTRALGSLDWELSPWSMLTGDFSGKVMLSHNGDYLQLRGIDRLSDGGFRLTDVEGHSGMEKIQSYLNRLPLVLGGRLSLKFDSIEINGKTRLQQAEGRVIWHQAGVMAPQMLELGDLQLELSDSPDDAGIVGTLRDSGGPLKLEAELNLKPGGGYTLHGRVAARETASEALRNSLTMLGKADSQGSFPLNFTGSL